MRGQTLIEALLALSIVGIILSGITVIASSSLNNAQYIKNQNLATGYAQEGMEMVRRIRNGNYSTFRTQGNYCLGKTDTSLQGDCSSPNIDGIFIRKIQILPDTVVPDCGIKASKIIVTVSWIDGKCTGGTYCHNSKLISCLSTDNPGQSL